MSNRDSKSDRSPSISGDGVTLEQKIKLMYMAFSLSKMRAEAAPYEKFGVKNPLMELNEDGTYSMPQTEYTPQDMANSKRQRRKKKSSSGRTATRHASWKGKNNPKKKKNRKMRAEGFVMNQVNRFVSLKVEGMTDRVADLVERVGLLIANLYDCKSYVQFLSAIGLFAKTFTNRSYTSMIKDLMDDAVGYMRCEGEWSFEEFMKSFRACVQDFKLVKANPIGEKVSAVIAFAIALGVCGDRTDFSLSLGRMKLFKIQAYNGHCSCLDLVEGILDTIELLVTRGYQCFLTGSARPLFCTTTDAVKAEEAYTRLTGHFEAIRLGQFDKTDGHYSCQKDYEAELHETIAFMDRLLPLVSTVSRNMLTKRIEGLRSLATDLELMKVPGGLRESPYGLLIHGPSGVGKSTLVDKFVVFMLQKISEFNGIKDYVPDRKSICTLNDTDKFMSGYKSYIRAVILDDLANAKASTTDVNPSVNVINMINNVRRTAVMADVNDKGKIQIEPEIVAATTNNWIDWARTYSNEPVSILRRFKKHLTVKVRPEFANKFGRLDEEKMSEFAEKNPGVMPNAWKISIFDIQGVDQGFGKAQSPEAVIARHKFLDREKPCVDLSLFEAMQVIGKSLRNHMIAQKSVVESSEKVFESTLCPHGNDSSICPFCTTPNQLSRASTETSQQEDERLERELLHRMAEEARLQERKKYEDSLERDEFGVPLHVDPLSMRPEGFKFRKWKDDVSRELTSSHKRKQVFDKCLEDTYGVKLPFFGIDRMRRGTRQMAHEYISRAREDDNESRLRSFVSSADWLKETMPFGNVWFNPLMYLPDSVKRSWRFRMWYFFHHNPQYRLIFRIALWTGVTSVALLLLSLIRQSLGLSMLSGITSFVSSFCAKRTYIEYQKHHRERWQNIPHLKDVIPEAVREVLDQYKITGKKIFGAFAAITAIYAAYKAGKMLWKSVGVREEGQASDDFFDQDYGKVQFKMPGSHVRTAQPDQMEAKLQRSLVHISREHEGELKIACMGFFVKSGWLIFPKHVRPSAGSKIRISHNHTSRQRREYDYVWHPELSRSIGDDLELCYVPQSGDMYDWTSFLCEEGGMGNSTIQFGFWTKDCQWQFPLMKTTVVGPCKTELSHIRRAIYTQLPNGMETFIGQCGGIALAKHGTGGTYISGMHLAGNGKQTGALESILRGQVLGAIEELEQSSIVQEIPEACGPRDKYLDKELKFAEGLPEHSPVPHVGPGCYEIHGYCASDHIAPKSSVRDSYIRKEMEEEFGVPQRWGPPANCRKGPERVPHWKPYQTYLEGVSKNQWTFSGKNLQKATDDYTKVVLQLARSDVKPLNHSETLNGVDKEPFMRSMKSGTSMGYPINKPKEDFFFEVLDENNVPRKEFTPGVLKDIEEGLEKYKQGLRNYCAFKACTKDEPTKLESEKVRVFQAANYVLQYSIRKYYLPLCNLLSKNPIKTECAVGINPNSPEWDKLYSKLAEKGKARAVAGDFKNYDHKSSPVVSWAVFSVFFELAKKCGYSAEDIRAMRAIASDIIYPVMNMNGHLMTVFGSNPSGQNLTVYFNSVLNSILHRFAFFEIYPGGLFGTSTFQDAVALTTYGDDCLMTVRANYPKYNHTSIQSVFAKHNCVYTMADKEQASVPYVPLLSTDFLKRQTKWREEFLGGMYIPCLNESSILKSLYCNMLSDHEPPESVAASSVNGAIREWWFHGREIFEDRQKKLLSVAKKAKIESLLHPFCFMNYDQIESEWRMKFQVFEKDQSPSGGKTAFTGIKR